MNRLSVVAVLALGLAGCQQAAADAPVQTASQLSALGVAFDHAAGQQARACDDDTPRCMILTDPSAEAFMRDLLTIEVHDGPLETIAAEEAGFVRDASGRLMTTYGRFEPVPVEAFQVDGKQGLRAVVACGISDPETGFHAGAGECLWAVVSDGTRSVVISSSGFGNGLDAAEATLPTLRFLPPQ
ncbi:MAG: hypothetical protein V4707_01310 [Pseudomonadota bacterium]